MKNPAPYMRKTLVDFLFGNISYNSQVVPVYGNDEMHLDPLQIVIGEYSDADQSNKANFVGLGSQVVEVISEQRSAAKKTVDAVGELVMNLIQPAPGSETLSGTDFQVQIKGKPSIKYLIEQSGSGTKIVRLIMTYKIRITER